MKDILPDIKYMVMIEETGVGGYTHLLLKDRGDFVKMNNYLLNQGYITEKQTFEGAFIKDPGLYRIILDGIEETADAFKKAAKLNASGGIAFFSCEKLDPDIYKKTSELMNALAEMNEILNPSNKSTRNK